MCRIYLLLIIMIAINVINIKLGNRDKMNKKIVSALLISVMSITLFGVKASAYTAYYHNKIAMVDSTAYGYSVYDTAHANGNVSATLQDEDRSGLGYTDGVIEHRTASWLPNEVVKYMSRSYPAGNTYPRGLLGYGNGSCTSGEQYRIKYTKFGNEILNDITFIIP